MHAPTADPSAQGAAPLGLARQYSHMEPVPGAARPAPEPPLVTLEAVRAAAARVAGIVVRTPLLPFGEPFVGDPFGRPRTWLKPESLQPIGAFKLRGAWNALASLTPAERAAPGVPNGITGSC